MGTQVHGLHRVLLRSDTRDFRKVQRKGTCPSIAIDKTDGILTYLSKETLSLTSFLTSKSSDMQVSFPNEQGDMVEAPIPEQFRHTAALVAGKPVLSTDVSDL